MARDSSLDFVLVDSMSQAINSNVGRNGHYWMCTAVYASAIPTEHDHFWLYLQDFKNHITYPWQVLGDFNKVVSHTEGKGDIFFLMGRALF